MADRKYHPLRAPGSAFFFSLGVWLSIFSFVKPQDFNIYQSSIYVFYSVTLSLIPAIVIYVAIIRYKRRFERFFGISNSSPLNLILSTYSNRQKVSDNPTRYYKTFDGEVRFVKGHDGFIVGLETAQTAVSAAFEFGSSPMKSLIAIGDELPLKNENNENSVICLGSSTSNCITERILDRLPGHLKVNFTPDSMFGWIYPDGVDSDETKDYGIVVHYRDRPSDYKTYTVCAGIDEQGTVAISRYLLKNWKKLPQGRFVALFECRKNDLSAERRVLEEW